jgi:hypothetical protein
VVDIRPVRPSEHERLGALTRAAYATLFDDLDADGYGAELEDVAGRADHALVLVAVDGGDVLVGGVTYVGGPGTPMSEFADAEAAGIRSWRWTRRGTAAGWGGASSRPASPAPGPTTGAG